jgi:hypothetical protein
MPKLKISEHEAKDRTFKATVKKAMVMQGIENLTELSLKLGMVKNTLYVKFRSPEKFSILEVRKLAEVLKLSKEDIAEIV